MPPVSPAALLLIDVQQGFRDPVWGARNNPAAEIQMSTLLAAWRQAQWPVIHVKHMSQEPDSPLRAGLPGNAFQPAVSPLEAEPVFPKTVNSAFIGTALEDYLRRQGIQRLVIVGLTTDHCVSTTARMAGNLGFEVLVVEDATATFERTGPDGVRYAAEQMHRTALASLHGEFARVILTQEALAQLPAGIASTGSQTPL